jgi:hypothetical protein
MARYCLLIVGFFAYGHLRLEKHLMSKLKKERPALSHAARITVFTSEEPEILTKRFFYRNGEVTKVTVASMYRGRFEVVDVNSPKGFSKILQGLGNDQAIGYGFPTLRQGEITTLSEWEAQDQPKGFLPRIKEAFPFRKNPGIMMMDYDPDEKVLEMWEIFNIFCIVCPGLKQARFIWWPSSGSYIYDGDEELIGLRGQRFYFFVTDASDIPRAGKAIETYLWAAGYGQIKISSSGSMLLRTLVDTSVWQGNHLDFASGAKCKFPLEQRRGKPKILKAKEGDGEPLDTGVYIPEPDQEVQKLAKSNIAKAKAEKQEEALQVRLGWVAKKVAALAAELNPDNPTDQDTIAQAQRSVDRAIETDSLDFNWIINVQTENGIVPITVGEILQDKERWNGCLTQDPIDPGYDGGRLTGKLFLTGTRPNVHSKASGGSTFYLTGDIEQINLIKGQEHLAVDSTLKVLVSAPPFFDFGEVLVFVTDEGRTLPLKEATLSHKMAQYVQFVVSKQKDDGSEVRSLVNPPFSVCNTISTLSFERRLKKLRSIITAPTIRQDGSIVDQPGYDPETELFLVPNGEIPLIYRNPSTSQVRQALRCLWRPFRLFPFEDGVSKGVHLAALLTTFVSPILPLRPCFAYDASLPGSGKTLLAKCLGVLATGREPSVYPPTEDEAETRKRVFSALLKGEEVIIWDNIVRDFNSATLNTLLTSEVFSDRVLGKSESQSVPNTSMLVLTGNNLRITNDMVRRTLVSRIVPDVEDPHDQSFDFDPLDICKNNRMKLVGDGLTILRGFISQGRPRLTDSSLGSFNAWDDLVRQCVLWIADEIEPGKFGDPLLSIRSNSESDPDRESLGVLLSSWYKHFGGSDVKASELLEIVDRYEREGPSSNPKKPLEVQPTAADGLASALTELSGVRGKLTARSLGKVLSARKDQIVRGLKLLKAGRDRNGVFRWQVKKV